MAKVKQSEILRLLSPYTMEVITPGGDLKAVKIDEFLGACITNYKHHLKAVNVSYYKV